jgi:hypothetical protein
MIDKGKGKY